MTLDRRLFLRGTAYAMGACVLSPFRQADAASSHSRITVLLDEGTGSISPDLYGYLLENIGTAIYDGIWVGENSKIPNINGIRRDVIERLREIKASLIRWPGGNFADYYDWQDGVGPRARRPRRTNVWSNFMPSEVPNGPQRYDPNQFGTPEFMQLCKLTGGRPFLNVNTRSLTPESFSRWVEYCNSPAGSTTLADARKADGSIEPYGVRYWGIGNETWGYGGSMSVEEYASLYKLFASNVPRYGVDLQLLAAGALPGKSTEWVREFLKILHGTLFPSPVSAISIHYYATLLSNELKPGETMQDLDIESAMKLVPEAAGFGPTEWYHSLECNLRLEDMIEDHWLAMGEWDPKHKIKLAVDEWGAMYKDSSHHNALDLRGRAVTLRDALGAGLTLDILNRNCNRVAFANFTGLINQEGGLMQTDGARFCVTPVYHVFRMYAGHQGGRALRSLFDSPILHTGQTCASGTLASLSGSASIVGTAMTLTVVNPHVTEPHEASISLNSGEAISASVATLTNSDISAQNTFDEPDKVYPTSTHIEINGSEFRYTFPAASVTSFTIELRGRSS
jgi:alpha-N-arabinofuranosidase